MGLADNLIGTFGSLLGGTISSVGNIAAVKAQNKANKELAQYQYEQQKQMIREQNAYNTPAAQMQRYQDAGLNPHLIYGDGKASAGNQTSVATYQAPTMQAAQPGDYGVSAAAGQYMSNLLAAAELKKKDAEIGLLHQNTVNAETDNTLKLLTGESMRLKNSLSEKELSVFDERFRQLMELQSSQQILNFAQGQLTDSNRFLIDIEKEYRGKFLLAKIEQTLSNAAYARSGIPVNSARISEIAQQILNLKTQRGYLIQQGRNVDARTLTENQERQIRQILLDKGLDINKDGLDRILYNLDDESDSNTTAIVKSLMLISKIIGAGMGGN